MNTIVLDLEWNQSSTGKEAEVAVLPFEIIEIGAIKLNDDYTMISEFSELIKPQVYRRIHSYTSKLIHLQMEELESGDSFENVATRFLDWCGEDYRFCIWGTGDLTELQRNLKFFGMPLLNNGPVPYLDVQKLFSMAYEEDRKVRRNLEYAVDYLRIEKDIPFHRAFSDAYYTAKVLSCILKDHADLLKYISYDVTIPPQSKEEEVHICFGNYEKYITRVFANRDEALTDKEVLATKCYLCGRKLRKKIHWFSSNRKHYYSVSICPEHGFMKGKLRLMHYGEESVFIVKTTKLVSEEEAKAIESKRNKTARIHEERRLNEKKKAENAKKQGQ